MKELITSQGPGAIQEAMQAIKGANLNAAERDLAKLGGFSEFISQNPWIPGSVAGAAIGAVGGTASTLASLLGLDPSRLQGL